MGPMTIEVTPGNNRAKLRISTSDPVSCFPKKRWMEEEGIVSNSVERRREIVRG